MHIFVPRFPTLVVTFLLECRNRVGWFEFKLRLNLNNFSKTKKRKEFTFSLFLPPFVF